MSNSQIAGLLVAFALIFIPLVVSLVVLFQDRYKNKKRGVNHMDRLQELVHLSIGRASMCWSEIPRGVFNDVYAHQIAQELLTAIEAHVQEAVRKDRVVHHLSTPHVIKDTEGHEIARTKGTIL